MTAFKSQKLNIISFVFIVENNSKLVLKKIDEIIKKNYLAKKNYEFLVIDNKLPDEEKYILYSSKNKYKNLRIISLAKKYDFDSALICALDNVIGDAVLVLNYYNDDYKIVKKLIDFIKKGYDVVICRSNLNSKIKFHLKTFIFLINRLSSTTPYVNLSNTLALNRRAVNFLTSIRKKNRFFAYLTKSIGLNATFIDVDLNKKFVSEFNKTNFIKLIIKTLDIIISNSTKPLRIVSFFSAFASFLSFLFILYVFLITLIKKNIVEGWISTTTIMGVMFFMLFVILTVLSEYILRILEEVKEEPLYFIEREIDHSIYFDSKANKLNIFEKKL